MSVFGPKYPSPLQHVVSHGERLYELLARSESSAAARERAEMWLRGRAREVELIFEVTLFDWASGKMTPAQACASLEAYLDDVHASARKHGRLGDALTCCDENVVLTAPKGEDVETILAPKPETPKPSSCDTWFDPGAVLEEVLGGTARGPNNADRRRSQP